MKEAQDLYDEGKYNKALRFLEKHEGDKELSAKDKLDLLVLKSTLYNQLGNWEPALTIAEKVLQVSQNIGSVVHHFDALHNKIEILFNYAEYDKVLQLTEQLENIYTTLINISSIELIKRKAALTYLKANINFYINKESTKAFENLSECLKLREKIGNKSTIALTLWLTARFYYNIGDLDQALNILEQIIVNEDFPNIHKCKAHGTSVLALRQKGELERAISVNEKWQKIAREVKHKPCLAASMKQASEIARMQGDLESALELGKLSFEIAVTAPQKLYILLTLIEITIEMKNDELSENFLKTTKEIVNQSQNVNFRNRYQLAEALILKSSTNIRDRIKAEMLLKDYIATEPPVVHDSEWALIQLCDLLLTELRRSNDMNLFDEINPIINQLGEIAENQNSSWKLAETFLLKAKLAFIQLNMGLARKFLTQAQELADNKGLGLLAQKISNEHDLLLDQLSKWGNIKEKEPPLSERIEFSSFEGVIKRLLETRPADPPEIIQEDPILLMIIAEGGVLLFSYPFTDEWKRDNQLFGSFLTAFTSFSNEFFSEGLDRVKFGQYTVLMENLDVFSIGYVYKGQTYPAKQKLKYFVEKIQTSTPIKQTLDKYYQRSQVIEPKDFPFLEAFITDIFSGSVPRF
ncbi:MAG: tetratricopeptide repeat protein [Candidatus Thorarchaeota archaeon]